MVDRNGERCYGVLHVNTDVDWRNNTYCVSTFPVLLPGRWTCCGRVCLHDHPQCPFYHEPLYDRSNLNRLDRLQTQQRLNQIGCTPCEHASIGSPEILEPCSSIQHYMSAQKFLSRRNVMISATLRISDCPFTQTFPAATHSRLWRTRLPWNTKRAHSFEVSRAPVTAQPRRYFTTTDDEVYRHIAVTRGTSILELREHMEFRSVTDRGC